MFELNLVIYHRVKLQRHRRYKFCERKQIQLFELLPLKPLNDFFEMLYIFKKSEEDLEIEVMIQNLFSLDCN